jgi:hypothetical protein
VHRTAALLSDRLKFGCRTAMIKERSALLWALSLER